MPSTLFRKGLEAEGDDVRRSDDVSVRRVRVQHEGAVRTLYRVRIEGRFPARALRYEVSAGSDKIGYGVPSADGNSLVTVTSDESVLGRSITADYPRSRVGSSPQGSTTSGTTSASITDPSRPGPHAVATTNYNLGEQVFQPSKLKKKVEIKAKVKFPKDLGGGPYPLVVFMHGNHSTCFRQDRDRSQWPCKDGWKPLPSHTGYDYVAEPLASHGYVVVSISVNGVNALGSRLDDTGMRQRGEVLDRHLRLWRRWSTTGGGALGDRFVGAVDMTRIGTMGHSRGGEGVVWHNIVDSERSTPFGVDAVFALAPVDFTRATINHVPFATALPTCDGDVSDLQGIHFFDDSRYNVPGDPAPKHAIHLYGANHNHFNEVWSPSSRFPGAGDDGDNASCGLRLREQRQRRLGAAYMVGFFRRYLEDELAIDPMWTGAATPGFTGTDEARVTYHAPDTQLHRKDVVRFSAAKDLRRNQQGGEMRPIGMARYGWCKNTLRTPCLGPEYTDVDIHHPGLAQAVLGWEDPGARLGMRLPVGSGDVSGFDALQFRAVVPPGYAANGRGRFQDFVVVLIDGNGDRVAVPVSETGNEALAMPGRFYFGHIMMNQVRMPIERFEGIDLTNVREVRFRFSRVAAGTIHVSDVAFSRGGAVLPKV